jgi:hypothetical protein
VSAVVAWIVKREDDNDRAHIYQDRETTERLGGGTARPLIYGDTVAELIAQTDALLSYAEKGDISGNGRTIAQVKQDTRAALAKVRP